MPTDYKHILGSAFVKFHLILNTVHFKAERVPSFKPLSACLHLAFVGSQRTLTAKFEWGQHLMEVDVCAKSEEIPSISKWGPSDLDLLLWTKTRQICLWVHVDVCAKYKVVPCGDSFFSRMNRMEWRTTPTTQTHSLCTFYAVPLSPKSPLLLTSAFSHRNPPKSKRKMPRGFCQTKQTVCFYEINFLTRWQLLWTFWCVFCIQTRPHWGFLSGVKVSPTFLYSHNGISAW